MILYHKAKKKSSRFLIKFLSFSYSSKLWTNY